MKSNGILPDTCAWIDYFRPGSGPLGDALDRILSAGQVYLCGPVLYELVQGARSEKEQTHLLDALNALPFLEMTAALWLRAGRLSASLRRKGKTIPYSDILIATLALEHELAVLTADEHFRIIPGVVVDT